MGKLWSTIHSVYTKIVTLDLAVAGMSSDDLDHVHVIIHDLKEVLILNDMHILAGSSQSSMLQFGCRSINWGWRMERGTQVLTKLWSQSSKDLMITMRFLRRCRPSERLQRRLNCQYWSACPPRERITFWSGNWLASSLSFPPNDLYDTMH